MKLKGDLGVRQKLRIYLKLFILKLLENVPKIFYYTNFSSQFIDVVVVSIENQVPA